MSSTTRRRGAEACRIGRYGATLTAATVAFLVAQLAGCAAVPPAPGSPAPSSPTPFVLDSDLLEIDSPPVTAAEIDNDPVYQLLIAEFAGQRGQLEIAVDNYLKLARQTRNPGLAERATKVAVFARNNDSALAAAKIWVELAPEDLEARQIIAAMYIRHGDAPAALEHLEYVLAKDPSKDGGKLRMIANLLGREEDKQTALAVMEQLLAKRKSDPDALVAYALLAMRADQLDKARAAMEQLVTAADINPNIAMAYMAVLQKQGLLPEALGFLEVALARTPDEFGLRLLYARLLADAERYEEARMQFTLLEQQVPDNTDVLYALGLLNLQTNRIDDAERNFRALAKFEERADDANYYLGQIEESRKKPRAALARYRTVQAGGSYLQSQLRIAFILSAAKKVDDARAVLAAAKPENDEQKAQLVLVEAEILAEHERLPEAMAVYDRGLAGGYNMTLLYNRAMLADRMGRMDILEADLRTILKREPDNAQALNALGYSLADRTERYDEAYQLIKRALEITPNDFYVLDSMGWVLYRLGRLDEAVTYLEKARDLRNDPEVAAHLGEVLWVLGKREAAHDVWNSALEQHPSDAKILDAIERLTP